MSAVNNNNNAINSQNIKKMIIPLCEILRKQIMEEIQGKLISIKVDAATRFNRSFLGINIQFMLNSGICLRTCRELTECHTGSYIVKCADLLRNDINITYTLMDQVFGEVEDDVPDSVI